MIAHEIGHIRHSDTSTNMHAAVAIAGLGGLYELGRVLLDSRSDRSDENEESGGAASLGLALVVPPPVCSRSCCSCLSAAAPSTRPTASQRSCAAPTP